MHRNLSWSVDSSIRRFLSGPSPCLEIIGTDSPTVVAGILSSESLSDPEWAHLIVTPDKPSAQLLVKSLGFFNPQLKPLLLPASDVTPYSGLHPQRTLAGLRVAWLFEAQRCLPGTVFISPVQGLVQRTLPFSRLAQSTFELRRGIELPHDFHQFLIHLGYHPAPLVEDLGTFSQRGAIVDIFTPQLPQPVRLELWGNQVESLRHFDPESQRSGASLEQAFIVPAREILISDEDRLHLIQNIRKSFENRPIPEDESAFFLQSLAQGHDFPSLDFALHHAYSEPTFPLDHFSQPLCLWMLNPLQIQQETDRYLAELKAERTQALSQIVLPEVEEWMTPDWQTRLPHESRTIEMKRVRIETQTERESAVLPLASSDLREFFAQSKSLTGQSKAWTEFLQRRLTEWRQHGDHVLFTTAGLNQAQRLKILLEKTNLEPRIVDNFSLESFSWPHLLLEQSEDPHLVHIIPFDIPESFRLPSEQILFIRDDDLFGTHRKGREHKKTGSLENRAHALDFGSLKPGDLIVHKMHGIGIYEGLKVMPLQGHDAELIQIKYKDNDRLYLPVYRIGQLQKFSGPQSLHLIDKLGGLGWEKTKTKVRAHLRDMASELLKLYAERSQITRPPFSAPDHDFFTFESTFPYEETDDQLKAIQDILSDLQSDRPMDRLICGDVGFGKTEIAMRAAFKVVQDQKQVAVMAPTTVLTFQHIETFRKRFAGWPVNIRVLNRFVSSTESKKTLQDVKEGKVDILIGTHRLLSQDVRFKNLGLLVVDEEQRFGVKHKERLRKIRLSVDTLTLSATPIPRTLNLSLMGIRDLSIINTPPMDRLPTRTFVSKFEPELLRKAVLNEVSRGGQVYFIHNRVQSIHGLADELRNLLPEVKFKVAHGQMEGEQLEKIMVEFFHHEIDMLLCTTIVESGMDVARANTMIIDNAHQLGLSQLYQLRGRVGRSKDRAYCYLLVPGHRKLDRDAQERLRILQENTALGSGIRIAQYDLELRGAGDILGENQAGHINAVGYELYMELLEEAIGELKGEKREDDIEPEINLRLPALIPDSYISDLRIRLAYYKALSDIDKPEDLDRIEGELRDQFGPPPESVINLLGVMAIRKLCKDLHVRDLSAGKSGVTLSFLDSTPLSPQTVIELTSRSNKKYALHPEGRLAIRMNDISWPRVFDELNLLIQNSIRRPALA